MEKKKLEWTVEEIELDLEMQNAEISEENTLVLGQLCGIPYCMGGS